MVRLIDIDAEIREPLQHFKALVADQLRLVFGFRVEIKKFGKRIPVLRPHLLGHGLVLVLDLEEQISRRLFLVRLL